MTEDEVKRLIASRRRGDSCEEVYGPNPIAGDLAWEIWVYNKEDEEYQTRFVVERANGAEVFDTFQQFCNHYARSFSDLSEKLQAASLTKERVAAEISRQKVSLGVAALAFVATVGTFLYVIAAKDGNPSLLATTTMLGLVASGTALFFGKWIPVVGAGDR